MNIIKVKFLKDGQPSGREYTYFSENPVVVDDKVQINSSSLGVVTEINVPEEEIELFKDKVKFIHGTYSEIEDIPLEDITVEETNLDSINIVAEYKNGLIKTNFAELKLIIAEKVAEYKKLVVTEANKPKRKKDVAALRKIDKDITSKVSALKADYLREFEVVPMAAAELKELTNEAITAIDNQVKELEEKQRMQKQEDIKQIFNTIIVGYPTLIDEIGIVVIYDNRWENISATPKSIKDEMTTKLNTIRDNVALISSMVSDKTEEALSLFWGDLDAAKAMQMINRYEAQKREIQARMEEQRRKDKEAEEERQRIARERELEREKQKVRDEEMARIRKEEENRKEEQRKIAEAEERARADAIAEAEYNQHMKELQEAQAMAIKKQTSVPVNYIYGISATEEEFEQLEMYLNSLGVEFERIG